MDKFESTGLTIAVAGHVALFGLLSVGFLATPNADKLKPTPIEVSLTDNVGLESQAPLPHQEELAAKLSPVESAEIPEPAPAEPAPEPQPAPKPAPPKAQPAPDARPQPSAPSRSAANTPSNRNRTPRDAGALEGIMAGITTQPSKGKATTPPAAKAGVSQASLAAEIRRQVLPHWQPLGGLDAREIATLVRIRIGRDGALLGDPQIVDQKNVNANNRGPAEILRQRALAAVKAAMPIDTSKLPAEYYANWRDVTLVLDRRK